MTPGASASAAQVLPGGTSISPSGDHDAPECVKPRLDEATMQGLLEGKGGPVPSPRKKALNRGGESISDTVSKNRE